MYYYMCTGVQNFSNSLLLGFFYFSINVFSLWEFKNSFHYLVFWKVYLEMSKECIIYLFSRRIISFFRTLNWFDLLTCVHIIAFFGKLNTHTQTVKGKTCIRHYVFFNGVGMNELLKNLNTHRVRFDSNIQTNNCRTIMWNVRRLSRTGILNFLINLLGVQK